jgi:poly-gamma-glutamate system protein
MNSGYRNLALCLMFALATVLAVVTKKYGMTEIRHPHTGTMRHAQQLAEQWAQEIGKLKAARGVPTQEAAQFGLGYMLGDEFTELTTTMGSLEAKVAASNPAFAALMVRLLIDAGIDSTSTVGVTQSGSFPSLAVATLAALQTIGCDAVVVSSLGASMYGANQPQVTWLDMEAWLRNHGGLRYQSEIVTPGAEADRGEGLLEGGLAAMYASARRTGYNLVSPLTLEESINRKMILLTERHIDLLVNIGGNQASVGACVHAVGIPNGYHARYLSCSCAERGLIARFAERGVPFIHLLNIRDLAVRYGLEIEPGTSGTDSDQVFVLRQVKPAVISGSLIIMILSMAAFTRLKNGRKKPATNKPH